MEYGEERVPGGKAERQPQKIELAVGERIVVVLESRCVGEKADGGRREEAKALGEEHGRTMGVGRKRRQREGTSRKAMREDRAKREMGRGGSDSPWRGAGPYNTG